MDDDAREAERQRQIADAILGEDGDAPGRLGVYRRLVRSNLAAVARRLLPRTAASMDRVDGELFGRWLSRFLAAGGSSSPYLRDVPRELVAWASPGWTADTEVPPFVADLARYEMDCFEVESAPSPATQPELDEVAPARPLVFASPRKLASYAYAVHEALDEPPRATTCLLVHRDADNEVVTTRVDAARAPLLCALLDGASLGEALAATHAWTADPDAFLREVAAWLAALGETGALLGGAR